MSKPTTSTKKSRSTAPAVNLETVKTDGTQDDAAVTTSVASDPSGLRAPDGNNTGPADADGSVADQNLTGEGHAKTDADAATASVNLSTEPSQSDEGGAGANAGSGQPKVTVADLLREAYVFSTDELLHWVNLGRQFKRTLRDLVDEGLVSELYIGSTTPVDAFRDLAEKQRLVPTPAASEHFANLEINAVADQVGEHADRYASMDHEQFERDFPLSYALLSPFTDTVSAEYQPLLRVTSKRDGFRRGGIAHSTKPVDYRPGELSPEQLETILAEPLLTVEVID